MIELSKFDARDDIEGVEGGWMPTRLPLRTVRTGVSMFEGFQKLFSFFGAEAKQRRMENVLRDYPHSLYGSHCGHLIKQR